MDNDTAINIKPEMIKKGEGYYIFRPIFLSKNKIKTAVVD